MPSYPEVSALLGQVGIRISPDLSMAFNTNGANSENLVQLCVSIGFMQNRQDPLFSGSNPLLLIKPFSQKGGIESPLYKLIPPTSAYMDA